MVLYKRYFIIINIYQLFFVITEYNVCIHKIVNVLFFEGEQISMRLRRGYDQCQPFVKHTEVEAIFDIPFGGDLKFRLGVWDVLSSVVPNLKSINGYLRGSHLKTVQLGRGSATA